MRFSREIHSNESCDKHRIETYYIVDFVVIHLTHKHCAWLCRPSHSNWNCQQSTNQLDLPNIFTFDRLHTFLRNKSQLNRKMFQKRTTSFHAVLTKSIMDPFVLYDNPSYKNSCVVTTQRETSISDIGSLFPSLCDLYTSVMLISLQKISKKRLKSATNKNVFRTVSCFFTIKIICTFLASKEKLFIKMTRFLMFQNVIQCCTTKERRSVMPN